MATNSIPFGRPPHNLDTARAAFTDAVDAAAERASRKTDVAGMPHRLFHAGCYLAANGCTEQPCAGEFFFGLGMTDLYRYLIGLSADARAESIEAGRAVLFDGRWSIVRPELELAA